MVREKMNQQGKFFLYNRQKRQFLQGTGIHIDEDGPVAYTHWTPYLAGATSFNSIRAARNMRRLLEREGTKTVIVDNTRRTVE